MRDVGRRGAIVTAGGTGDGAARDAVGVPAGGAHPPVRPEDVRIGDREREDAAARLARAQSEGRLDLHEYDERLQAAYAARTAGELARVTADLPAERVGQAPVADRQAPGPHRRSRPQRAAVAVWASVSLVNLLIWAVICVATGSWIYPW